MVEIKIYREATISDMPQIRQLILLCHKTTTPEAAEKMLNESRRMWICEIDNRLVAVVLADSPQKPGHFVFVHPKFSTSGISEKLEEMAMDAFLGKTQKNVLPKAKE